MSNGTEPAGFEERARVLFRTALTRTEHAGSEACPLAPAQCRESQMSPLAALQLEWARAAQAGDRKAAGKLLRSIDALVWQHVNQAQRRAAKIGLYLNAADLEDMQGDVNLLLFERTIPRFDAERAGWVTYATQWIRFGVQRWIECRASLIRLPVWVQRCARREAALAGSSSAEQRRPPTTVSLDAPRASTDGGREMSGHDQTPDPAPHPDEQADMHRVREAVARLEPRHCDVLTARMTGHTLDEIGKALGMSTQRAQQIEQQALEKVRRILRARQR